MENAVCKQRTVSRTGEIERVRLNVATLSVATLDAATSNESENRPRPFNANHVNGLESRATKHDDET